MEIVDTAKSRWALSLDFKPSRSILKTPGGSDLSPKSRSRSNTDSPLSTPTSHVRFGEVEVLEFEQKAGRASQGVPEKGAVSLYMGKLVDSKERVPVEKFEEERKAKLLQRAQNIHNVVDDSELYTRGRQDLMFSSYSYRDRLRKYQSLNDEKLKPEDLKKEEKELAFIRKSREQVGCSCKPLSQLSVVELRQVLVKYGLPTHGKRQVLQDRVKADVLQSNSPLLARFRDPSASPCYSPENTYRFGKSLAESGKNRSSSRRNNKRSQQRAELDKCCWDDSCECVKSGIRCHQDSSCGCLEYDKPCDNPDGQYIYKGPHYPKKVVQEWLREYNDVPTTDTDNETETETSRSRSCSQENSESQNSIL